MIRTFRFILLIVMVAGVATADQYWIAYEGNDFPENEGWERTYGDGNYPPQDEPHRWLEDGVLVIDTSRDPQLWEYYSIRPITDPEPGELFVAEWRVRLDLLSGPHDGGVLIARDRVPADVSFTLTNDFLEIWGEVDIPIAPGEYHAYRFESEDMVTYRLLIDAHLAHAGHFNTETLLQSKVAFGPATQGASSTSYWDYFRFGVVPEAPTGASAIVGLLSALAFGRAREE